MYTGVSVVKERTAISTIIQELIYWTNLNMEPVGSFETSVPMYTASHPRTMKSEIFVSTPAYKFRYTA
jgi:hypothetical protein